MSSATVLLGTLALRMSSATVLLCTLLGTLRMSSAIVLLCTLTFRSSATVLLGSLKLRMVSATVLLGTKIVICYSFGTLTLRMPSVTLLLGTLTLGMSSACFAWHFNIKNVFYSFSWHFNVFYNFTWHFNINKSTACTAPCYATAFTLSKCHNSVKNKMVFYMLSYVALHFYKASRKSLKPFSSYRKGTTNMTWHTINNVQRAVTPKAGDSELLFLCFAHHIMVIYICIKFQKNVLKSVF